MLQVKEINGRGKKKFYTIIEWSFFFLKEIKTILNIIMNVVFKIGGNLGTPGRIYWTNYEIHSFAKDKVTCSNSK